jgi:hypothetical protein
MSKRALFAHAFLEYWIDVAAKLRDQHGWDICYFVGKGKLREKTLKLFPQAVFHTKAAFLKNLVPDGCETVVSSPLDKELLTALSSYESIFIKMMDRYNFNGSLTYHERIATYHFQLMYWKGALEHFQPDIIVYPEAPHLGYDYVLYALCRIMNIPPVMFERTSLPGFVYPVASFEDGSEDIRKAYTSELKKEKNQEMGLSPQIAAYLESLLKRYDRAMPFHQKYKLKHLKNQGDIGGTTPLLLGAAKDLVIAHLMKNRNPHYLRKTYYTNIGHIRKKKLLAYYRKLANDVNLEVPYLFVALQCEPERQSGTLGGVFTHQYVMIDLLSKVVPQGWKIYVKEHPFQFKESQMAERAKTFEFYDLIASIPKVSLVPLSYNSFELIDRAKASATVAGTVGWESVVRGTPTLLFGYSWYRDCKGVFVTHTIEECKKAIRKIRNGYKVNVNEVKCFARVVEKCSVRGYVDRIYSKMNIVSPEENVENLARAIHEFTS